MRGENAKKGNSVNSHQGTAWDGDETWGEKAEILLEQGSQHLLGAQLLLELSPGNLS